MTQKYLKLIVLVLLPALRVFAGEEFAWQPITAADWSVVEDSSKGIRDAVMIFEKVTADDNKYLANNKCYLTIYRRIKIFNAEGRKWGDVTVPYLHRKQKVEAILGRAVLPNGEEFPLAPGQILEKEILKAKGVKIKQKSFLLPGIADGCIVEYMIKYRLPQPYGVWLIQKEIVLQSGEFRWLFNRETGMPSSYSSFLSSFMREYMTPNYLWLPHDLKITVKQFPSIKEPTELFFSVAEVPAFEEEPNSLPEIALQEQLRYYYSGTSPAEAYWGELSKNLRTGFDLFTKDNKRVKSAVAAWQGLESEEKKIAAAYDWLQTHLKNITYLDEDDANGKTFKDNKTADETLKRGYGSQLDINLVFYDMLRELNIDAKMAYAVDRDENLFVPDAKYWQFDRALVAVPNPGASSFRFYSPGDLHLPMTHAPWFSEGVSALMIDVIIKQFAGVPFSSANYNRTSRVFTLALQEDLKLAGKMSEQRLGHAARAIHLLLAQTTPVERQQKLQEELKKVLPGLQIDSVAADTGDRPGALVKLECKIEFPGVEQGPGGRVLLQPFEYLKQSANPFQAEQRRSAMMFDYGHELIEVMNIALPETWMIEALPADTAYTSPVGHCAAQFSKLGETLSVQRMFRLNRPYWPASEYANVRKLFQAQQAVNNIAVVLKKQKS